MIMTVSSLAVAITSLLWAGSITGSAAGAAPAAEPLAGAASQLESAGMEGFRAYVPRIERAVADRDPRFFVERARLVEVVCPGPAFEHIEPRCAGQPEGTVVTGVWRSWWRGEGLLVSLDGLREDLGGFLGSLREPTVHAIGDQSGRISDFFGLTNGFFAVVTSSDSATGGVMVLTFEFSSERGRWQTAIVTEVESFLTAEWLSGECADCYAHWERWQGAR